MNIIAMTTLNLKSDVSNEQRDIFFNSLKEEYWVKIEGLTTTWKMAFEEMETSEAKEIVEDDLKKAARQAGIVGYKAATMIGPNLPLTFETQP